MRHTHCKSAKITVTRLTRGNADLASTETACLPKVPGKFFQSMLVPDADTAARSLQVEFRPWDTILSEPLFSLSIYSVIRRTYIILLPILGRYFCQGYEKEGT